MYWLFVYLLLFALRCAAAPQLNPTSFNVVKSYGPVAMEEFPLTISTTPSGCSWSLAKVGGDLDADYIATEGDVKSGITPQTIRTANGYLVHNMAKGVHSITWRITVGGACSGFTDITYTVNVVARYATHPVYHPVAVPGYCTNTNAFYDDADTCIYPDDPGATATPLTPAAVGSTVSTQFGSAIRTIRPPGWLGFNNWNNLHQYPQINVWTYDNANVMVSANGGIDFITPSGTVAWSGTGNDFTMLSVTDFSYWDFVGNSIKHTVPTTPPNNFTSVTTSLASLGMSNLRNGASAKATRDNWIPVEDPVSRKACAVNTNGMTAGSASTATYCATYSTLPQYSSYGDIDMMWVTEVDVVTNKRYLVLMFSNIGIVYSVDLVNHNLHYEGNLGDCEPLWDPSDGDGVCELPGEICVRAQHQDSTQFDGEQVLCTYRENVDIHNSGHPDTYIACQYLNRIGGATSISKPMDIGGGMRYFYPIASMTHGSIGGVHVGCSWVGVCAISLYVGGLSATDVTAITATNPPTVTTNSDRGWGTGTKVSIGGALGGNWSCIQGFWTVNRLSGTQYTVNGANCTGASGTYTSGTAQMGLRDASPMQAPYGGETLVFDQHSVTRMLYTRAFPYDSNNTTHYYQYPMSALSPDGTKIAFHSNFGLPTDIRTYTTSSGWTTSRQIHPTITPKGTSATIAVTLPESQSCTITTSAQKDLSSPVSTLSPSGTTISGTISGLTLSTDYYTRVNCGSAKYVWTGSFNSTATAPPVTTVNVSVAVEGVAGSNNVVFDYGTTTALGTTSSPSPCAPGAQCSASAAIPRGDIYVRPTIRNSSNATLATGALTPVKH